MRKGKDTTFNQRQLVIFHHANGKRIREISELLQIKFNTVGDIIRRYEYKNEDRIESKAKSGPKRKLTIREERNIVMKTQRNPQLSSPKLVQEVQTVFIKDVSASTIQRVLHRSGYNARVARKKPFVNSLNRNRRVQFARTHRVYDFD